MPRGGYRASNPGGRPKGSKTKLAQDLRKIGAVKTAEEYLGKGQTPLEFLINAFRDESKDDDYRLAAANRAADFCHCKKPQEVILQAEVHIDGVDIRFLGDA